MDDIDKTNLIVCNAFFCNYCALYTDMPKCIGGSFKEECLCIQAQCCLNIGTPTFPCCFGETKEGEWCVCGALCIEYKCKAPNTLCRGGGQLCCTVQECAFPCVPDIPSMCVVYGLACTPKFGCCLKFGELAPATGGNAK